MEAFKEIDAMGRERWTQRETLDASQLQGDAKTTELEDELENERRTR